MKTIARKRSKVKKKASSKKAAKKKAARSITRKAAKKAAKKTSVKKKASKKPVAIKKKVAKPVAIKKKAKRASDITRSTKPSRPKKPKAKKRKAVRRKTVKRPAMIKDLDAIDRLAELVRQQLEARGIKASKKIPRTVKKGKRKIVEKKGPLRAQVERMLSRPMAEAQMLERLEDKLPRGFFRDIENWVETEESVIIQRLAMAEQLGVFDEEARENALEFDWDLRDVYELWHSPDVYF